MALIKHNLKKHEIVGLMLKFLGTTCYGVGLFTAFSDALRPLILKGSPVMITFSDILLYAIFFGIGGVLNALAGIELKESLPARYR